MASTKSEKRKAYKAKSRETNQRKVVEYLLSHHCVDCGESDMTVLEFDHVKGIKRNNVSTLIKDGYSWKSVQQEIDKCEVRCANCHRRRTSMNGLFFKSEYYLDNG